MNKRAKIATALGSVLVLAGVGAGVSYAAIPDSNTGVITGCYSTLTGSLKVIDAQSGQSCGLLQKQLTWNQTGPVGPQGAQGPQGVPGPQGPSGANSSYTVQEYLYTAPVNFPDLFQTSCSSSYPVVISGSVTASNSGADLDFFNVQIRNSENRSDPNAEEYDFQVTNSSDTTQPLQLTLVCGQGTFTQLPQQQ